MFSNAPGGRVPPAECELGSGDAALDSAMISRRCTNVGVASNPQQRAPAKAVSRFACHRSPQGDPAQTAFVTISISD